MANNPAPTSTATTIAKMTGFFLTRQVLPNAANQPPL